MSGLDGSQDLFDSSQGSETGSLNLDQEFDCSKDLFETSRSSSIIFDLEDGSDNQACDSDITLPPSPQFGRKKLKLQCASDSDTTLPPSPQFGRKKLKLQCVPGYPDWFNMVYDGDNSVYTYHKLEGDVHSDDLIILV